MQPASRFAGFALAFVAGAITIPPDGQAQRASAGVFDVAMRSGVSGVVRDRSGKPQVGAAVELLNAQYAVIARTFTDDRGRYALPRVGAGVYQVKATASLLLPAIRPDLRLLANTRAVVNLTLANLYQALDWLPAEKRAPNSPEDDWDWTLRLSTNRPLLRVLDTDVARLAAKNGNKDLQGPVLIEDTNDAADRVTWGASTETGLARFGEGGMEQRARWAASNESGRAFAVAGSVAAGPDGLARAATTAAYRQELSPDRSMTTVVTFAERPGIAGAGGEGLETLRVRSSSTVRMGDLLSMSAGTELAAARLGGETVAGSHPFASLAAPVDGGVLEYKVSTARTMTGADALEREAQEDMPALVETAGRLAMEEGLHQELAFTRKVGSWTGELGIFDDVLAHPVVEGWGDKAAIDSRDVLYDPGTGIIAVSGQGYSHGGVMALLRDQLSPDTWMSFRYAMGEAIAAPAGAEPVLAGRNTQRASVSVGTRFASTGTVVRGSYRWQPVDTVTAVAPFAGGAPDAYLGLSVRQPLHLERVGTGRVEAILDVRNLLAQGYRPFLSQDGTTVYFAQAQRCVAGGIRFSF